VSRAARWSIALVLSLALVGGAVAAADGRDPAHRNATTSIGAPGSFRNLRVCPYESYSIRLGICLRDFRGQTLTSTRLVCSVDVIVRRPAKVGYQWLYAGQRLPPLSDTRPLLPGAYRRSTKIDTGGSDQPVPGGALRCVFSFGTATIGADLTSGGPVGEIVNVVACTASDTFRYGTRRDFPVCRADTGSKPLPSGEVVVCNATYSSDVGRLATIEVEAMDGARLIAPTIFTVHGPLEQAYMVSPRLQSGDYRCRFTLDGADVAVKPFHVG
jgi:hypothetical protein